MSNIKAGDIVKPFSPRLGLPIISTWRVEARIGNECELSPYNDFAKFYNGRVYGRRFSVDYLETVGVCRRTVEKLRPISDFDSIAEEDLRLCEPNPEQVIDHDMLVAQAAQALDAAKEHARKTREEARAAAKAEAKRKAVRLAAKRACEEHEAVALRLHNDLELAAATSALIAELIRLHNGGAEHTASPAIAMHAEQLQPLAKSYGYNIAKPGVIAIVVKA